MWMIGEEYGGQPYYSSFVFDYFTELKLILFLVFAMELLFIILYMLYRILLSFDFQVTFFFRTFVFEFW